MGILVCVGDTTLNKISIVVCVAHKKASMLVSSSATSVGGRGAAVAAMVAQHGVDTALLSTVGRDAASQTLLSFLTHNHVNTSGIRRVKGRSARVDIYVDEQGQTESMFFDPGATENIGLVGLTKTQCRLLKQATVIFLTSVPVQFGLACLENIELDQKVVSSIPSDLLTFRHSSKYINKLLQRSEFLLLNDWEAISLQKSLHLNSLDGMFEEFANLEAITVTRGAKATAVLTKHQPTKEVPVRRRRATNLVGAGDGFAAGFLVALTKRSSVLQCVRSGHSIAGRVVSSPTAYATAL